MGESTNLQARRAAELIDELFSAQGVLARAQARRAALMVEFSEVRALCDRRFLAEVKVAGSVPRYRPGEFGAMEIGAAVRESKYSVEKVLGMAGRLRAEAPDAWDAWLAGDIDQEKARRINRALRRLVRDSSKQLLNSVVVDVAVCKTAELLGRWLNQFVARVEPDETEERLRRSMADRYVSVRPDLDGVSAVSALVSSVDAEAIDQVLTAVAAVAEPGDGRTLQQRRADALVDLLLGRISNGCGVRWDGYGDGGDVDDIDVDDSDGDDSGVNDTAHDDGDADEDDISSEVDGASKSLAEQSAAKGDERPADAADAAFTETATDPAASVGHGSSNGPGPGAHCGWGDSTSPAEIDEWDLPASAFRPDPVNAGEMSAAIAGGGRGALPRLTAGPGSGPPASPQRGVQVRPVQVNIGVIISAASLFGFTDTPGQLADRSALVSAQTIRELAARRGTLFHRLLTDERGNLLDVTELGRFPSRKLGLAIAYRDGVCTNPVCHVPARRCDLDHVIPFPDGPTAAGNLDEKCRPDHRAKTHAGHRSNRTGPHSSSWTTPTGHTYHRYDDPLPVEAFPVDRPDPPRRREVHVAQWSWRAG